MQTPLGFEVDGRSMYVGDPDREAEAERPMCSHAFVSRRFYFTFIVHYKS